MREREIIDYHTTDSWGTFIKAKLFEISVPDDFLPVEEPKFAFSEDCLSLTVAETITQDLRALRETQRANPAYEYGLMRVSTQGMYMILNTILQGTENSVSTKLLPKQLYEKGRMLLSEVVPFTITDDYHTHTPVEGVAFNTSNLFSANDILAMGHEKARRFWLIDVVGGAHALVNPSIQEDRYQFDRHGYTYGEKFKSGYAYADAHHDLLQCVEACGLLLFYSTDYVNFRRITRDNPPYESITPTPNS